MTVGAMLAAAGLGFAGYVYAVPYHKLSRAIGTQEAEIEQERAATSELSTEVEKLKGDLARRESAEQEKAATDAKKKHDLEALVAEVKTTLGALGATTSVAGGKAIVSLASASTFDQPTSTVISPQGDAALKVLGGAIKKYGFRTRVKAKLIPARPPRELSQFQNIGEFVMLRAVRIALALASGGVAPDHVAAAGEEPPPMSRTKGKPVVPERLDVEIEPG